jgi:hypothetical protein
MILNQRHKSPVISFGLALTVLSCEIGDEVNIWQNEIYNGNEYFLEQDEISSAVMFSRYYYDEINPFNFTDQNIEMIFNGFVNQKPSYICEFNSKTFYIYFNLSNTLTSEVNTDGNFFVKKWVLVTDNLGTPTNNVISYLINDGFYPLNGSLNWVRVGYDGDFESLLPLEITINVNPQGFILTATESKQIQVAIVNKNTGHVSKSNKIELIAITSFGNNTVLFGNETITFI